MSPALLTTIFSTKNSQCLCCIMFTCEGTWHVSVIHNQSISFSWPQATFSSMVLVNLFVFFCFLPFLPSLFHLPTMPIQYVYVHVICVHMREVLICVIGWRLHLRAALGCLVREGHVVILGPVMYKCVAFVLCLMTHCLTSRMRLYCLIYETYIIFAFNGLRYIALAILQIVCSAINNSVLRLSDGISIRCNCLLFSHWFLLCLWSHRVLFGDWMCCCASTGILLEGGFQVLWIEPCTMYFQWNVHGIE